MTLAHRAVVLGFKALTTLVCRIEDEQLKKVPDRGPLIIVANHVNMLEIPLIYTRLLPRPATALVRADRWDSPGFRWLLDLCGALPLRRGEADVAAVRRTVDRLKAGDIVIIAPEGTRSHHGRLQRAHPGVVLLALHSSAPVLPLVHFGSERYGDNLRRLRRSEFHIRVGRPFNLDSGGAKVTRQVRRQMVDEIMYQMAALLPPAYRGVYSDLSGATERYLAFQNQPG